MQKQKEFFAKATTSSSATAPSTMNGFTPAPAKSVVSPDIPDKRSNPALSTALKYNPAYPSKQSPIVPSPAPNGFINLTVSVDIWPPEPNSNYFDVYMCYYPNLGFAVAGFGDTEAEALQDFLLAYHEVMVEALKDGRPIPILRFRFVRHKRNNK